MSPLRWTCKSTRVLAAELNNQGFQISSTKVGELLRSQGYSLQGNRKTIEGKQHPDRDAQFQHIAARVKAFQRTGQPVISVDTKKKEPLGNMKNAGKTYRQKGDPVRVTTHDFPDKELGKAVPYGVYDLTHNEAGVSVGISHDTAEFALPSKCTVIEPRRVRERSRPHDPKTLSQKPLSTPNCSHPLSSSICSHPPFVMKP